MENNIDLIKIRLNKATKGKWEWIEKVKYDSDMPILKSENKVVMDFGNCETYYATEGTPPNKSDAEFIVNAKSDIEYLINEIEKLKKERNSLKSELE